MEDAFEICKANGFVKHCLEDTTRRDIVLPVLPTRDMDAMPMAVYLDRTVGTLILTNDTRKDVLPDKIVADIASAIPTKFPPGVYTDVKGDRLDAFAVMSLAILGLLIGLKRADFAVIFYPPQR